MLNVEYRELAERNEELTEGRQTSSDSSMVNAAVDKRSQCSIARSAALEAVSQLYFEGLIAVAQPTYKRPRRLQAYETSAPPAMRPC